MRGGGAFQRKCGRADRKCGLEPICSADEGTLALSKFIFEISLRKSGMLTIVAMDGIYNGLLGLELRIGLTVRRVA